MLKIKDYVDLKELEKFGLKEEDDGDYRISEEIGGETYFLLVGKSDRWIYFDRKEDVLFDLIQAGLVEKVKEN